MSTMTDTRELKSYVFRVVIEPDDGKWFAYCPLLEKQGGATWGKTREEALRNLQQVLQMVVESIIGHGEEIPEAPEGEVTVIPGPSVAVTV